MSIPIKNGARLKKIPMLVAILIVCVVFFCFVFLFWLSPFALTCTSLLSDQTPTLLFFATTQCFMARQISAEEILGVPGNTGIERQCRRRR